MTGSFDSCSLLQNSFADRWYYYIYKVTILFYSYLVFSSYTVIDEKAQKVMRNLKKQLITVSTLVHFKRIETQKYNLRYACKL